MLKALLSEAWKVLNERVHPAWLLIFLLPIFILLPIDNWTVEHLRFADGAQAHKVAQFISKNGDFYIASMIAVVSFLLAGIVLKKSKLRLLALAMLLSCAIPGVLSLAVRVTSGRPRPAINAPDGLYGIKLADHPKGLKFLNYDFQAFPSGHSTTAFATAVPVLIVMPEIGIPLTLAAGSVSWARFQLLRHRPTDLYVGILIGSFFGVAFGRAVKKLGKEDL